MIVLRNQQFERLYLETKLPMEIHSDRPFMAPEYESIGAEDKVIFKAQTDVEIIITNQKIIVRLL